MDFSKFDNMMDLDGLKADVIKASENSQSYEEVPLGNYEVQVSKMELTESKKGNPMISVWFKIVSGDFKNSLIFMNQVITQGFQIHLVNEFLRSLDTGLDIKFDNFNQYANLIFDVHEKINSDKLIYELKYGEHKEFKTFNIVNVFETDNIPF